MKYEELIELHYITPIENVRSILVHGILCHVRAKSLGAKSIADPRVQVRRARKRIPGGLCLHEYVPLYFNARNPMMFRHKNIHEKLCVLRVSSTILELDGVVIADCNASSDYARFRAAPEGLALIGSDVFSDDWRHPDPREYFRRKSRICAEVLVPRRVPPEYIIGAYVSGEASRRALAALQPPWKIAVNPRIFFLT